jgi:hypothetical protein
MIWMMTALAGTPAGIPVTVTVVDPEGAPIPSAQIRHPEEAIKHRVNVETGSWTSEAVYLESGEEMLFTKKLELPLEVSAPGFETQDLSVVVNKKAAKNRFTVTLTRLDLSVDTDAADGGPSIGFKRDVPRD